MNLDPKNHEDAISMRDPEKENDLFLLDPKNHEDQIFLKDPERYYDIKDVCDVLVSAAASKHYYILGNIIHPNLLQTFSKLLEPNSTNSTHLILELDKIFDSLVFAPASKRAPSEIWPYIQPASSAPSASNSLVLSFCESYYSTRYYIMQKDIKNLETYHFSLEYIKHYIQLEYPEFEKFNHR